MTKYTSLQKRDRAAICNALAAVCDAWIDAREPGPDREAIREGAREFARDIEMYIGRKGEGQ